MKQKIKIYVHLAAALILAVSGIDSFKKSSAETEKRVGNEICPLGSNGVSADQSGLDLQEENDDQNYLFIGCNGFF